MLKCELFKVRKDGVKLVRTYSTERMYIKQLETNIKYDEAIDVSLDGETPEFYTYEETDEPIDPDDP